MTKKELIDLTKAIRNIYPDFKGYDDLINYKYEEVKKNFLLHKGNETPSYDELVEGLRYENEKDVLMTCELCGRKIHYTTWENFEKHHRRCSKIDFIDRQAKELKGEGIDKQHFYEMSDDELDSKYRKWMDNWSKTHSNIALGTILKTL